MSKAKRKVSSLTPDELQDVERRRAQIKARLRAAPHDEVEPRIVDPENPPLTDEELESLRPAHEVNLGIVAELLRRSPGYASANIPTHRRDRVEVNDDGSVAIDVGTINKVTLDNITDVHSHVIIREGVIHVHSIEFRDGGSVRLV